MQIYADNFQDRLGNAIPSAQVLVTITSSGVNATLYSDNGITPLANPMATDANGEFSFYAANNAYTLTFSGGGIAAPVTRTVRLFDPTDAAAVAASKVAFTSAGNVASTDVQAAIAEIDSQLSATTGASLVGASDGSSGSLWTTVQGFISYIRLIAREGRSVMRHIPLSEWAAIFAKTSTYDTTASFAEAFSASKHVTAPQGKFCVTKLIIPDGCSLEGDLSGNANATASYATLVEHIATTPSEIIACESATTTTYVSGGVVNNIGVIPNGNSTYGFDFKNPLGARVGNIYAAGAFSVAPLGIVGPLMFTCENFNYISTSATRTPAGVHLRSFDGNIIGTTAVFRRVYIHGHATDPSAGIYNAFRADPAACIDIWIEKCITESISGPTFEIGKGNKVFVRDHYIENCPNTDNAAYPIFRIGKTGAAAPNNAYDTTTSLQVDCIKGLGTVSGSPANVLLIDSDVAQYINLANADLSRINKVITGTNSTQAFRIGNCSIPSATTFQTGLSGQKVYNLGCNIFAAAADIDSSVNYGNIADRVNISAGSLFSGHQYWGTGKGSYGSLEIYDKSSGNWNQPLPLYSAAPTTLAWLRGHIAINTFAATGKRVGWICTGSGTPGTWEPFGQCGVLTSIAAIPDFTGQFALVGGIGYMSVGTASVADWRPFTTDPEDTAANIASKLAAINITGKFTGKKVWDTTNKRLMRAEGATDVSAWVVVDGSVTVTPA